MSGFKAINIPPSNCSECGTKLDCGGSLDGAGLKPGDISVCLYCGNLAALGEDLKLRPLTDEEMHRLAGNPVLLKTQAIRADFMKKKMRQ